MRGFHGRLGGERGAAHAQAAARILPQLLLGVQLAQRARDRLELVLGELLGDVLSSIAALRSISL